MSFVGNACHQGKNESSEIVLYLKKVQKGGSAGAGPKARNEWKNTKGGGEH